MRKLPFVLAATLLGGLALGASSASAAPMRWSNPQVGQPGLTQVRMMSGDRMMMRKRMMRKRMMRHHMMRRHMMHRM